MASQTITSREAGKPEGVLLERLLSLYDEESQIYGQVLELSRQQGEIVRRGGGLGEVRQVLQKKKNCLEIIGRLERMEARHKQEWELRRQEFSGRSRARLRESLNQVTGLIEAILSCEEKNDLYLIEQARAI